MNDITSIIEDCYKSDIVSDRVIKKVIEIIGQKEWQILHDENNDICTTMGELIITLDSIADLEKENAKLKCECRRCVYTDRLCIPSDFGKDRNGTCDHFKDVFDEVVELNDELKKWKDEWQEQVQKATDEGYARTLQTIQLTKAKFLLKQLVDAFPKSYSDVVKNTLKQAEQFLKDLEK